MGRTSTLAELRQAVLVAGGWEYSGDLTPDVLNEYVNKAVVKVWRLLVRKAEDYCTARATLTTTPGSDAVTVGWPATFQKLRKLELAEGSEYTRLRPTSLDAAHRFSQSTGRAYRYWLEGATLYLAPTPQAADSLRLFYIPYAERMVNDGDTFDGINGYEELVILIAKLYCERRQEMDTSGTERDIAEAQQDIRSDADGRDANEPFYLNPSGPDDDVDDEADLWA